MKKITDSQISMLEDLISDLENRSIKVKDLCESKHDEITYGFEFGKIHFVLTKYLYDLREMVDQLNEQN